MLLVVLIQTVLFFIKSARFGIEEEVFILDELSQARIDSMKAIDNVSGSPVIKAFNPNYISDYKGYVLGMSPEEIDRLFEFRASGRFVNSSEEFQEITQVSDSLLMAIAPYFQFPGWVVNPSPVKKNSERIATKHTAKIPGLNQVNKEELIAINGIGEVLSRRIIKFRNALGGFLVEEQLYDVYGLDKEVADRVIAMYTIKERPEVEQLNVNQASMDELAGLVYIPSALARRIVAHRSRNGNFESWDELTKIEDFPVHQIDRIKLYLTL